MEKTYLPNKANAADAYGAADLQRQAGSVDGFAVVSTWRAHLATFVGASSRRSCIPSVEGERNCIDCLRIYGNV